MEAGAVPRELSDRQLREARQGFLRLLRKKRMHPHFIAEHGEELLAHAQAEYAVWLKRGEVATNPPGWIIHCAWRRTQDQLESERRRPQSVSMEAVEYQAEHRSPGPEQRVLEMDRHEQLMRALAELTEKEREMLQLTFFGEMTVIGAGEKIGLAKSSADRCQKAALRKLHELLDGAIDVPAHEIGLAAWVAVTLDHDWLLRVESLPESLRDAPLAAAAKLEELSRRLTPVADPAHASAMGPALRAAGICSGAVAALCLASGAVGPGVEAIPHAERHTITPTVKVGSKEAPISIAEPTPPRPNAPAHSRQRFVGKEPTPRLARPTEAARPGTAGGSPTNTRAEIAPPRTADQQSTAEFGIEGSAAPRSEEPTAPPAATAPSASPPPSVDARSGSASSTDSGSKGSAATTEFGL